MAGDAPAALSAATDERPGTAGNDTAGNRPLPFAPLARRVALAGGFAELAAGLDDTDANRLALAYHRAREAGAVTLWAADRLCIELLGEHPMLVFGDAWLLALDTDRPGRPDHDRRAGKPASNSAYSRGCRCAPCTRAHADYTRELQARRALSV